MIENLKLWVCGGVISFFVGSACYSGETPGSGIKEGVEKTIKACEDRYTSVKVLKEKLFTGLDAKIKGMKKPGVLSLPKAKKEYQDKVEEAALMKKAFEEIFNDFSRFTNEKIEIRTAKTTKELKDVIEPYSSNCTRFADGLVGFVDWALTGKSAKGYDIIYKDWLAHAKKGK